jgi:hypothetical protein
MLHLLPQLCVVATSRLEVALYAEAMQAGGRADALHVARLLQAAAQQHMKV